MIGGPGAESLFRGGDESDTTHIIMVPAKGAMVRCCNNGVSLFFPRQFREFCLNSLLLGFFFRREGGNISVSQSYPYLSYNQFGPQKLDPSRFFKFGQFVQNSMHIGCGIMGFRGSGDDPCYRGG